jgi:arginine/serine-rich splicing factor 16
LDHINDANDNQSTSNTSSEVSQSLERQINYERYRNLVQNEFLGLTETKFLQQIWLEERFGMNQTQKEQQQKVVSKKKLAEYKATIAYNYEEQDSTSLTVQQTKTSDSSESEESSDEDYDFDTTVNIDQLDSEMGHRINSIALKFGMKNDDFVKFLDEDKTEAEKIKLAKELENEKSMFTGRKSRRERRAIKEQRLLILRASNVEDSDKLISNKEEKQKHSQSSSESEDSVDETKIEFITCFGGSSEDETRKESVEKKQKQVISKRKQKVKTVSNDKNDSIPIVYGPTLPGEDLVSTSHTSTSFNKNSHSRKRTYRYNRSSDESHKSRSRSRSRSNDRRKYRRTSNRYESRKSRSRSLEVRRSSNRTPDRYRTSRDFSRRSRSRKRSSSPNRNRRRSRSRKRSRSKNRSQTRSKRRSRSTSRSRRRERNTSKSRKRSKSNTRNRRKSRSVSRSRRRSRSVSKTRKRSRSISKTRRRSRSRNKDIKNRDNKTSNSRKRSPSNSQNKKEIVTSVKSENMDPITSVKTPLNSTLKIEKSLTKSSDLNEVIPLSLKDKQIEEIVLPNDLQIENEDKIENRDLESTETLISKEGNKVPSPPLKSYYRHDLCDESSDSEHETDKYETETKGKSRLDSDEGYGRLASVYVIF